MKRTVEYAFESNSDKQGILFMKEGRWHRIRRRGRGLRHSRRSYSLSKIILCIAAIDYIDTGPLDNFPCEAVAPDLHQIIDSS